MFCLDPPETQATSFKIYGNGDNTLSKTFEVIF